MAPLRFASPVGVSPLEPAGETAPAPPPTGDPALLYYADGLLQVPIRISVGNALALRQGNVATRPTITAFHHALRAEPVL